MDTASTMTFAMVEDALRRRTPPFDFSSAKECRTALKQVRETYGHRLGKRGLDEVPVTMEAVDRIVAQIADIPPASTRERAKRKNIATRLRKLARVVSDASAWSPAWHELGAALTDVATADGVSEKKLIPVLNTLKSVALEDGLDPADLTADWLTARMHAATAKRRESLREAAKLLDRVHHRLPVDARPRTPFGDLSDSGGGQRRSGTLPPGVASDLSRYLEGRTEGISAAGLREDRPVTVAPGIKPGSTVIYDQAVKWFLDSLRVSGLLTDETMPRSLRDAARLDWLSKVAFQALDDHAAWEDGGAALLPWHTLKPKTIESRVIALRRIFSDVRPDFEQQTVPRIRADGRYEPMTAKQVTALVSDRVEGDGMTSLQRSFCVKLIGDEDLQRLLLNMHTICWRDAREQWRRWEKLERTERRAAMDLCVLASILAIVVHYPFRAGTVTRLTCGGTAPDVVLPRNTRTIDFSVSRDRMKNGEEFEAVLEDTPDSQPRKLLDWFIAGPRQTLLQDPDLLAERNRDPARLFGGVDVARYAKVLSEWTERQGMRMTTHGFRHAIATILVNLCGARLDDVARMLGNRTTEVVARHYVMLDAIRRRSDALAHIEAHRRHLNETKHPGRRAG